MKEFLSYSRNERLGILALLAILLVALMIPLFLPKKKQANDIAEFKAQVDEFEKQLAAQSPKQVGELFVFDPNNADSTEFCRLGFSPAQAAVILKYRNNGGKFHTADDFKRMYVVSDSVFVRLKPYLQIAEKPKTTAHLQKIELNTADTTALKSLAGIGSYYAHKIVDRRKKLGGYVSANQLMEIYGIDEERFNQFKNQIKVDVSKVQKININTITANDLCNHPYFELPIVRAIIRLRKMNNKINSLSELVENNILSEQQAEKVKEYLLF